MKNAPERPLVLLVDDEEHILRAMATTLKLAGSYRVLTCQDSREVPALLARQTVAAVITDLRMPHLSGQELLAHLAAEHPGVPAIVVTAVQDLQVAVQCIKAGAADYLVKPVEQDALLASLGRLMQTEELQAENRRLRDKLLRGTVPACPPAFANIITCDLAMLALFQYADAIALTSQPVLITGETGVGKELLARAIHAASRRRGPLVAVNLAGLDDTLLSDSLFGHQRGAFTGAGDSRAGLVEKAADGTLFLDEIGDLAMASQVKLLRLLQEREYFPLGSDEPRQSRARIVVATHHDLVAALQADNRFRKDLYYRLSTHHVHLPPLRERRGDIPLLVKAFAVRACQEFGTTPPALPAELLHLAAAYDFPGNVRELETLVFDALARGRGKTFALDSWPGHRRAPPGAALAADVPNPPAEVSPDTPFPTLKDATRQLIEQAMQRADGNQTQAAKLLGISQQALNQRLRLRED